VGVCESEEVGHVRILEYERRREIALVAERGELLADEAVGLLRQGCPLVEHASIFWASVRVLHPSIRHISA